MRQLKVLSDEAGTAKRVKVRDELKRMRVGGQSKRPELEGIQVCCFRLQALAKKETVLSFEERQHGRRKVGLR